MSSKYEILEDTHETSVYEGNVLVAVFFGDKRVERAQTFAAREEYKDELQAAFATSSIWDAWESISES